MKLGEAYYCDSCDVEIRSGSHCNGCDPQNGTKEITYTFIVTETPQARANLENLVEQQENKPWWKIW